ncbi:MULTISPECIES: 3-oxoacyl-ACP reductase FabG [Aliivibrio]|uniref:3-oxoacyl-ACP reductase FabG n=1 Tax=Aliivibrio finisterrensis TaxID=511998 RepID=A0A4Q5KY77_9GAMM|nr:MULTISPECIES: 3-oxoacyl-ACP reductase FabG [Aliivibrio]MDD9178868.1 3-oxoacyl-ACP reductase FabG [Aliivibrio sp. A6]RYU51716.1 3-oxoacyl-ACP reductase FabG [Aliivibrio finisterrensis]RYU53190.1 3-oxoacyl-ACP reductase FabG [Aliivibrio finisterrensis]RYU58648.1 3-oxoacyl-ACP reductase FabG [Aliivibrio finisterrensis]RYU64823.1 3-oxoacyl-ACP reductase FabG [Aliivibrio finisterrensis]
MTRQVLVTGASKGIGRAISEQLAKDGFFVVVHYMSDKAGAEQTLATIEENGGSGRLIQFDISDRAQCKATLENDIEAHGAYYGVVSNAGITRDTAFPAMTEEEWDGVIHTNLDSFYNVLHPCVMPMVQKRKGGRIVTLASVSGIVGNRGQTNYSAAKAGVIGATKSLALELAKRKITVNCVAPGLIDTGMVDEHVKEHALPQVPLRRMGDPEEVAGLVSYLMSDVAGYVTRQVISINGGLV